jgi:hypothetical protein
MDSLRMIVSGTLMIAGWALRMAGDRVLAASRCLTRVGGRIQDRSRR